MTNAIHYGPCSPAHATLATAQRVADRAAVAAIARDGGPRIPDPDLCIGWAPERRRPPFTTTMLDALHRRVLAGRLDDDTVAEASTDPVLPADTTWEALTASSALWFAACIVLARTAAIGRNVARQKREDGDGDWIDQDHRGGWAVSGHDVDTAHDALVETGRMIDAGRCDPARWFGYARAVCRGTAFHERPHQTRHDSLRERAAPAPVATWDERERTARAAVAADVAKLTPEERDRWTAARATWEATYEAPALDYATEADRKRADAARRARRCHARKVMRRLLGA